VSKTIFRQFAACNGPALNPKKQARSSRKETNMQSPSTDASNENWGYNKEEVDSLVDKDCNDVTKKLSNAVQRQFKQVKEGVFCFKSPHANLLNYQRPNVSKSWGLIPTDAAGMPFVSAGYQDTGTTKDGMKVYAFT